MSGRKTIALKEGWQGTKVHDLAAAVLLRPLRFAFWPSSASAMLRSLLEFAPLRPFPSPSLLYSVSVAFLALWPSSRSVSTLQFCPSPLPSTYPSPLPISFAVCSTPFCLTLALPLCFSFFTLYLSLFVLRLRLYERIAQRMKNNG